jgi:DNA-binding NarL/FixJ family response regulator
LAISGFAATIEVETRAEGEEMSASRQATRRWSSDEERKLDELLDAGKEATEIAVALNRSRQAVYARLQRLYRKRARLSVLARSD